MQALQVTKSGSSAPQLHLNTVPKPTPPPGYLLVKVKASLINPSDVLNVQGRFPHTTFPRIPGRDFAGIVVEGPSHWNGKAVFGTSGTNFSFTEDGAHAEYCVVREAAVVEKPEKLSFGQAASVGTSFTAAATAIARAQVKQGETVLVIGANGGVGAAAVQLARLRGYKVLGAARGKAADIDSSEDPELGKAKTLTNGKGPDVVIDTVGDAKLAQAAIEVLAFGGRYSFIAAPKASSPEVPINLMSVYRREVSLIGTNTVQHAQEELAGQLREMSEGFNSGALKAVPEDALTFIKPEGAVEAYAGKGKKFIISFD